MAFDQTKFIARFLGEAQEHCAVLNNGLLAIERHSGDPETMNALFRAAHSIKGSSRMMKLLAVTEVAHKLEDVLDALRAGRFPLSPALSGLLFSAVDVLIGMLEKIGSGETIAAAPAEICEQLEKAALGEFLPLLPPGAAPVEGSPALSLAPAAADPDAGGMPPAERSEERGWGRRIVADTVRIDAGKLDDLIKLMGEIVSGQNRWRRIPALLKEAENLARRCAGEPGAGGSAEGGMMKELQARLHALSTATREDYLLQHQLIGQLQESSLKMRMLPLSLVFDTLPRTVRDMAHQTGKEIDFIVEGGETELDKKIIEKIGDPLLHMIRNAIDHGIEDAAARQAAGKSRRGTIRLSARCDGGSVTILLQDDGGGIPLEKIREKALHRKLVTEESLSRMSEQEVVDLIFLPGLSTSAMITDLSGRGVGMDVVRQNIVDELRGTIQVTTRAGEGSAFTLRLPLNLAMFRLLLVSCGDRVFAVPATEVREIVLVNRKELIEVVDRRAVRLRDRIIPVESLARLLSVESPGEEPEQALLMIVAGGGNNLGLMIDDLLTEEDMVVKPLPRHMGGVRLVAGVAVGSGNEIINVLQVPALLREARELRSGVLSPGGAEPRELTILVVDDSVSTREIEQSILEAHGYRVDVAGNGAEALEKALERRYDAVVTDVEMPVLDGFSLTEKLRADASCRDVPVIIVTSRASEEDKRRGLAVGANAYIVKGAFEQSSLLDAVRNLIG